MIEIGTILQNRYRIERQIGQGGMGKVYVASDERFSRPVAIKETVFEDKNLRRAFEREARLLNSLKHQALPRVSDHFVEGEGQFLVMEYISGEDLAEMMERRGRAFSLDEVLNWTHQLCEALEYLHSQDIIHRDIKPQNLKLTTGGQIVLLDFGLAKGNPTDSNNTVAKSIFGYSRSYASLEQIQGTGTEPRSDLYSLGATVYHLLTGIPPADALTRAMNVLNGQSDPLVAADLINDQVPPGIADVLQKTMALNANERPESANELRRLLDESDRSLTPRPENFVAASVAFANGQTVLKPVATNAALNQSHVATKLFSDYKDTQNTYRTSVNNSDSVVTNVRPAAKPKTFKAAAAGFGAILMLGSGLYFFQPSSSPTNFVATNSNSEVAVNQNQPANVTVAQENIPIATETNINAANPVVSALSPTAVAKNETRQAKKQNKKASEKETAVKTTVDGEAVTIDDNKIETRDMIIDENGVRYKTPRAQNWKVTPIIPPLPPEAYRTLSPEQIRKLEQLKLKQHQQTFIFKNAPLPIPKPKVSPTPKS